MLPVTPVFQIIIPEQPVAVRIIEFPEQILVLPKILGANGSEFTITVCKTDTGLMQLLTVQVALYVPEDNTVIVLVLTPFDQIMIPEQLLAVKTIFVPWHTVLSASSELIVGANGIVLTVSICMFEAKLVQLLCVQVAL